MQEYKSPNKIRQTVAVGILSAILLAGQLALAPLPNIELVSTLLIIYTQVFKNRCFLLSMFLSCWKVWFSASASGG